MAEQRDLPEVGRVEPPLSSPGMERLRCPYCGGPNPFWDDLDPRSWECTTCLAEAGADDPEAIR